MNIYKWKNEINKGGQKKTELNFRNLKILLCPGNVGSFYSNKELKIKLFKVKLID